MLISLIAPISVPRRLASPLAGMVLLSLTAASTFAQGGTAILALSLKPAGGDGYTALEAGAASPTGAASVFYNPAQLGELHRATEATLHAFTAQRDLVGDVETRHTAFALAFPSAKGFDAGFTFARTSVDYGTVLIPAGGTGEASETVNAFGFGLRFGIPLSFGAAFKF